MDGWDYTDYLPLIRSYSLFAKSQSMLSIFISQTLLQMDGKLLLALQARNIFVKSKHAQTRREQIKIMQNLGVIEDNGVLPKGRASHPVTCEELAAVNYHVGLSEERISAQLRLIQVKFKDVETWKKEWTEECKKLTNDRKTPFSKGKTKKLAGEQRVQKIQRKKMG